MIGTELVHKTFKEVRAEYKYPPAAIELHNNKNNPFFICNMRVYICPELVESVTYLRAILRHELGHPHIAPITIANAKRHLKKLSEILPTDRLSILTKIANIAYDILIDATIDSKYPGHTLTCVENGLKLVREKGVPEGYEWNILTGFYNCLIGKNIIEVPKKYQELGKIAYEIVQSYIPLDNKVYKIAELFVHEAEKESNTLDKYEYYKSKAGKNIIFKVKGTTKQIAKHTYKDALLNWTPDDPIESLETEESLLDSGILIPEITTL